MTVAEWKARSLGPVAGKRERNDVQKRLSTWNTSVLFTLTLNLTGWRGKGRVTEHFSQAFRLDSNQAVPFFFLGSMSLAYLI